MRVFPYWSKEVYNGIDASGRRKTVSAWGWSTGSPAEARQHAARRAKQILERLTGDAGAKAYDYLDHPLREEIVQTIGPASQPFGIITRNRYGALVLNAASVCFVDVDYPVAQSLGLLDGLRRLFSRRSREEHHAATREDVMAGVKDWASRNRRRCSRLYETAAGLRLLFTDRLYEPTAPEATRLLEELGSDPLYRRLTTKQESFRARLTPKPWRCGCRNPPNRYPWETPKEEQKYRQWQKKYERKAGEYGVCRLLQTFGPDAEEPAIRAVVLAHDQMTCHEEERRLA